MRHKILFKNKPRSFRHYFQLFPMTIRFTNAKLALCLLCLFFCVSFNVFGQQIPQAIQYQAVVRDATGAPIQNSAVSVRFSVRSSNPTGNISYQEFHTTTTNGYGLLNLVIGLGTPVSGNFSQINWAANPYFLQVEADHGSGYVDLGTTQMLSVPYALTSGKSVNTTLDDLTNVQAAAPTPNQVLQYNGSQWVPATLSGSGGGLDHRLSDADQDTYIDCENYPNENKIRVDVGGLERWMFLESRLEPKNTAHSIFIGENAGKSTVLLGDKDNTFVGHEAGRDNINGFGCTFVGAYAGQLNAQEGNTYVGANSGRVNTTGYVNTFLGEAAGFSNKTGAANTFIGQLSGFNNDNGAYNTFIGRGAGHDNISGHHNVYLGRSSAYHNADGFYNVYIGNLCGFKETTGSNQLFIDNDTLSSDPLIWGHFTNRRVGINRRALTNAFEVQGNASKSSPGEWLGNSDARLKTNIQPLNPAESLQKLLALQGVRFEWNDQQTGTTRPEGPQMGFIAQNIQQVMPELVKTDAQGFLQTTYGTYDPLTVEAMRALDQRVQALEQENKLLRAKMEEILKKLN